MMLKPLLNEVEEPEVLRGLPFSEYAKKEATNRGILWTVHNEAPKKADYQRRVPKEPSTDMEVGNVAHAFMFEEEWAKTNILVKAGRKGSAALKGQQEENPEAMLVSQVVFDRGVSISKALKADKFVSRLLEAAVAMELSLLWTDPDTGMRLKCRVDCVSKVGGKLIAWDLKTTKDASDSALRNKIARDGLHFQGAFYREGLRQSGFDVDHFGFVFVEQSAPHLTNYKLLTDEQMAVGERQIGLIPGITGALHVWQQCLDSGTFPGYADKFTMAETPKWQEIEWNEEEKNDE